MGDGVALVAGAGGASGRSTVASPAAAGYTVVAVAPEAIADLITFLANNAAAPVSGAVIPAYGA